MNRRVAVNGPHSMRNIFSLSIPTMVLLGGLLGITFGLFFGDYVAILHPIGTIYVMLLQVVVYPYIICTLLMGLGKISPKVAARLLSRGWIFYVLLLVITFAVILSLAAAIPLEPSGLTSDISSVRKTPDILQMVIPSNIFYALSNNYVPAVAIFCIFFGVALQHIKNTGQLFNILSVISETCLLFWKWLVKLAPFAIFALLADTFGTIKFNELKDFSEYILLSFIGSFSLAFWIIPVIMSCLIPVSYKEIMSGLRTAFLISAATTLSVVALPYIHDFTSKLIKKEKLEEKESEDILNTTLLVSYPFCQIGNFFVMLFILLAALYFNHPISQAYIYLLILLTYLSSIGSPSTIVNAVAFLSDWLNLPVETTNFFVSITPITRYGQVLASVMGFASMTILVTFSYYRCLSINLTKLLFHVFIIFVFLSTFNVLANKFIPNQQVKIYQRLNASTIHPDLYNAVKIYMLPPFNESAVEQIKSTEDVFYRILRTGVLRVGYNDMMKPFVFFNNKNQLVGYDVAMMYEFAKEFHLQIHFIPFTWPYLINDLVNDKFDIAIGGIYVSESRLQHISFSTPYNRSNIAFIVPADKKNQFSDYERILKLSNLRVGVFNSPVLLALLRQNFPNASIVLLDDFTSKGIHNAFLQNKIDAVFWSNNQTEIWTLGHPGYVSVSPTRVAAPFLMAYAMQKNSQQFIHLFDYWLDLKKNESLQDKLYKRWVLARPDVDMQPRWSILHNVLNW